MRRILVTAISGDVANGILKVLSETEDEIYGCDVNDYPVGMDKTKAYWKSDYAVSENYIDNLLKKCKEYGITHLIPVNEEEIKVVSANIEKFENIGIKVIIQVPEILKIMLSKYETYRFLNKIPGIHVPETYRYDEFEEDGKRYIVKLENSCGSKLLKEVTQKQELEEMEVDKNKIVIQRYLGDAEEEYTVGLYSNGKRIEVIIFKRKLKNGYSSFVELVYDESIKEDAIKIARHINLKGYINIQLRKEKNCNYIFEINPRISGTVVFRHMLGFKDVLWWLDYVDGKLEYSYVNNYKKAIGIRELSEKFLVLDES